MIFGDSLFFRQDKDCLDDIEIRTRRFYLKAVTKLLDDAFGDFVKQECKTYLSTGDVDILSNMEYELSLYFSDKQFGKLISELTNTILKVYKSLPFEIGGFKYRVKNDQKIIAISIKILRDYLTDYIIPSIRNSKGANKVDDNLNKVLSKKYFELYVPIDCFIFFVDIKLCEFLIHHKWDLRHNLKLLFNSDSKVKAILESYRIEDMKLFKEIRKQIRFY